MRIALGIEYDGAKYYGWQRQQEVDSVQARLEAALSKVADCQIEVVCAGRTDSGVHATGQVVHFDCDVERHMGAWTLGVNANLPFDVAVRWAKVVDEEFHARFSATARRYRYVILNHRLRPAILQPGVTHHHQPLDETRMHQAAQALLGEQDFSSFRAVHCQSKTPFRNVHSVQVKRFGDYLVVEIAANAFLHHMVRNIVGSLLVIGQGEQPVEWIEQLLALKDRTQAAPTAKANGLYLVDVTYPDEFELPKAPAGPLFLPDPM
ncbi:tRNA pseudouridine(38-40) synthase TruA [Paraferrimonas sedimenticola]|uniref:tRNA pseudouridine synthase A n=1 Tax=Paraferrimonas sedimenticola TaxID=375674 RepID=A0AA37RWE6_9GAMM|nr:tRNA pseudouridine(38-40) synthase TruA [Paraferrimonas sedimenticola]GLP96576.1 tRNA pseudouridine synthase A [Paraferrimonas sedimenticola]